MELDALKTPAGGDGGDDEYDFFKNLKTSELRAYINKLRDDDEIDEKDYKGINKKERAIMLKYCNENWSKQNHNETMGVDEFPAGYGQDN